MPTSSSGDTSLRALNRAATYDRVVQAAVEITRESGSPDFSMPQVAERSGIALRTLYRYFPTRQELIDALATVADQVEATPPPTSLDGLEVWLTTAWQNLLKEEALLRAQHIGPGGVAVRAARMSHHRITTDGLIQHVRPDLDELARAELVDLTLLLSSSTALFEFTDVIGVSATRGARLAAKAIQGLIESA